MNVRFCRDTLKYDVSLVTADVSSFVAAVPGGVTRRELIDVNVSI